MACKGGMHWDELKGGFQKAMLFSFATSMIIIHLSDNDLVTIMQGKTRIVRGSDHSPASELFARERQTMTGNNAKLDLVNVDAHKKIGQILTICS